MSSLVAADRRIAIARIVGPPDRKGFFPVTFGGDGLSALKLPFAAEIYKPAYMGKELNQILQPALLGPEVGANFRAVDVVAVNQHAKKGRIQLQGNDIPIELEAYWICIWASQLVAEDDEYYVYELIDLPVQRVVDGEIVARVKDYFQTGAHGVLEIELAQTKQLVLVPMLSRFVDFTAGRTGVIIPELDDFCLET